MSMNGDNGRPKDREELRVRLQSSVLHEAESGRRSLREAWARTIEERVEANECASGASFLMQDGTQLIFGIPEFHAKFREGESLFVGDGRVVEEGLPVKFGRFDASRERLILELDRFEKGDPSILQPGARYVVDRRGLGLERLLLEGLDSVFRDENAHCIDALLGRASSDRDEGRYAEGLALGKERGFTERQCEALARAISGDGVTLVQGPPGTGKTRVIAEAVLYLARKGCRVFVGAFTHRAVNNVLLALRELDARVPLFKVGGAEQNEGFSARQIRTVSNIDRMRFPEGACVVGGTPFAVRKFKAERRFHFAFLDEAGQLPVVHGAIAMTAARRQIIVGDPMQLPPVRQGEAPDPMLGKSLYSYLEAFYPSLLLDQSFRLNEGLCRFLSKEFYAGELSSAEAARGRLLTCHDGGPLPELLSPEHPLVWARVDHEGRTRRSPEESRLIVDLVGSLLQHHRLPPRELAVLTPFRAQVRAIRQEIARRGLAHPHLVVDTVERMQGQERECVILSLVSSDRDYLESQAEFYFEPGRLNVSLSRARSKCIVVASRQAFRARPKGLPELLAAAHFKRLAREAHCVDLTPAYWEHGTRARQDSRERARPKSVASGEELSTTQD